ncbi:Enhancer of polycomb-like protein [Mycena chlorophos]|uniref:Enhancer of polycomb-like protein n=1 Tax=Mycena chlorophos TaxID=658473 RepID=A0A8H6WKZ8_MYCCL|nr:Enhancer of polycomb-like protein [Mycena chlorophos]
MAPRANPPPKKNKARFGVKYSLKIFKGDLPLDTEYLDDDYDDNPNHAVADVDVNEGNEHHLQAALATTAAFIPTPCALSSVENYDKLYGSVTWKDPITYLHSTTTVEEACTNALADHDYTYLMDEFDKQWLDRNNQEVRGEGTSASAAIRASRKSKDKEADACAPVLITEDQFELVMSLMEKFVDQKVLRGDPPEFEFFSAHFLEDLPKSLFASYAVPSWVPPSSQLVRIARTIYPHWKHRRSLVAGRRIQPALNFDESDFANESYICFRHRDNKPMRKTRGGLVVNHAEKLANISRNLSQVLDLANSILSRETTKVSAAIESQAVWNARQPMADLFRQFPGMLTKQDEERLIERPKKFRPLKSSSALPKVKVLPPTQSGSPAQVLPTAPTIQPSDRCAEIQQDVARKVQQEAEILKRRGWVDLTDDPFQPAVVPRAEKLFVDVAPKSHSAFRESRPLRVRLGRGGRRFIDRRSSSHPYLLPLRSHRTHVDGGDALDFDEEATRRLRSQWRFDADSPWTGPPEEEARELVDEFDTGYIMHHAKWAAEANRADPLRLAEASLVTDPSFVVQAIDGRTRKALPFLTNAIHLASVQGYKDVHSFLVANGLAPPQSQQARARPQQVQVQAQAAAAQQRRPEQPAPLAAALPVPVSVPTPIPTPATPTPTSTPTSSTATPRPRALRDAALPHPSPNGTGPGHSPVPVSGGQQQMDITVKPTPAAAVAQSQNQNQNQNQNHMPPTTTPNGRALYVPTNSHASFKVPMAAHAHAVALQRATAAAVGTSPRPVAAQVVGDGK